METVNLNRRVAAKLTNFGYKHLLLREPYEAKKVSFPDRRYEASLWEFMNILGGGNAGWRRHPLR